MDERTNPAGVIPPEKVEQTQRLDALISRIEERDMADRIKQQLRDHPLWFSAAALGLVAVVGGVAAFLMHNRRQQPLARLARAGGGVLEALRTIDHVASTVDRLVKKEPTRVGQVSAAAASTLAATLARRLAERMIQRLD
jgi:hypothetical protein